MSGILSKKKKKRKGKTRYDYVLAFDKTTIFLVNVSH